MRALWLAAAAALVLGCVQMRDHAGKRNGAFTLFSKYHFGEGVAEKDYHIISSQTAIIVGDSKSEITKKIGLPDKIDRRADGIEQWEYKGYGLELQFKGDRLHSFQKAVQ